jgi:hypothetical protein
VDVPPAKSNTAMEFLLTADQKRKEIERIMKLWYGTYPPVTVRFTGETEINVWGRGSVSHHGKKFHRWNGHTNHKNHR